jgi:hypothetical protein
MFNKISFVIIVSLFSNYSVATDFNLLDYKPYFGIGIKMDSLNWISGFGNNVFRKSLPQGEFYVGAQVHDNIGFDIGYQATPTKKKFSTLGPNDSFLGLNTSVIAHPPISYLSYVQTKGIYAVINGMLPIDAKKELSVLGQAGIVYLNATHIVHVVNDNLGAYNILTNRALFNSKKLIPRLGIGLQYQPKQQNLGIRGVMNWDNTSRFGQMYPKNINSSFAKVKMKNTLSYGVSIYYQFL